MPRTARGSIGGLCYHVINRGNARGEIFHKPQDYKAFEDLLIESATRLPIRLLAYCLMPNHFHAAVWPHADGDLSRWVQWLLTTHVRRYHEHYHSSGHIWQGRFKAFPIQEDSHLLAVMRYIERNPLRAGLVAEAEKWLWSSLHHRRHMRAESFLAAGPVALPESWLEWVRQPQPDGDVGRIRASVSRGMPYGSEAWVERTVSHLGLESTLRSRGRPRRSVR